MSDTTIYFIEAEARGQRDLLCRWVEALYEKARRVQIATDSTPAAQTLDQQLWAFSDMSFVPHRIFATGAREPAIDPVIITIGAAVLPGFGDVLVCDGAVSLEAMSHFKLVVHFVIVEDDLRKQESRILWQSARDQGFQLRHIPKASNLPEKNL
jgi:DNA polymerase-3 subunit chi